MSDRHDPAVSAAGLMLLLASAFLVIPAPGQAQEAAGDIERLDSGTVMPAGLPFSEAVRHGGLLHLSGMVGNVPGTLELAEGGIEAEARQVMENIRTLLEAHGSSLDRVVKCTVFLADIGEWEAFNQVYRTFFDGRYPARSAVGVDGLALDARVEVECLAAAGDGRRGEPRM